MKLKALFALSLAAALFAQPVFAQTNSDAAVDALVKQVQAKVDAGKSSAADFQPELKQLDALIAAHQKDPTPDLVAKVTFLKAKLDLEVLRDMEGGAILLKKIKTDYPGTAYAQPAGEFLDQLDEIEESKKLPADLAAGLPFPDFAEKDLAGKPISVAGLKGKVVLIDFWATWCVPCRIELPNVVATYKKYHDQGFEIIGVSLDDDRSKLEAFLKQQSDVTWPQYYDGLGWSNKLVLKYQVKLLPCTILIGRDGKIVGTFLAGAPLQTAVADALAKK